MSEMAVAEAGSQRWHRWAALGLVLIGCIWLGWLTVRSQVSGSRLWLVGARYDAGKVKRGEVVTHRVWVFNPSLGEVVLKVEPSCGCSTVELPYDRLTPLNGFPVEVRIETWGLPLGYQEKVVALDAFSGGIRWQERVVIRLEVVP